MPLLLPALALLLSGSARAETTVTESEGAMSISFQQTALPTDSYGALGFPILVGPTSWDLSELPSGIPLDVLRCQPSSDKRWQRTHLTVVNDWGEWPLSAPIPPPKAILTFDKPNKAMRSGNRLRGRCLAKSSDGQDVVINYDITIESPSS